MKNFILMVLLGALTISCFGAFLLAEKGDANLSIAGSFFPGFAYDLEAEENAAGFTLGTVWLVLSGDFNKDIDYLIIYSAHDYNARMINSNIRYKGVENLELRAGYFKLPFCRMFNSTGFGLLFRTRNPMTGYFSNWDGLGLSAKYNLMDGRLAVEGGAFNGGGNLASHQGNYLKYSGYVSFAPWGHIPGDESAHKGYDEMKLQIMPGFSFEHSDDIPDAEDPVSLTKMGAHVAFRMNTLAADALFYTSSRNHDSWDDSFNDMGFSLQAGYAIGNIEPIFRFSFYDPDTDRDDDPATPALNSRTIIEAGVNYYFDSYSSRIGLNFTSQTAAEDDNDTMKRTRIDLFYTFIF